MMACAKRWVVSNGLPSRARLLAIGSRKLRTRPNSELGTHVLMKCSFKNSTIESLERTTALKPFPLAQQDSSKIGPSNETAWIGFCCAGAISNASSSDTQLIR